MLEIIKQSNIIKLLKLLFKLLNCQTVKSTLMKSMKVSLEKKFKNYSCSLFSVYSELRQYEFCS